MFLQDAVSTRRQVSPKRLSFLAAYFALALGAMAGLAGCGQAPAEGMALPPPAVTVSLPIDRDVVDYNDFTGRTAAVDSVKVRARVWGYLHKINFTEGAEVNKDDVLYEIDPRPYEATFNQATAAVEQAEARLDRLDSDYRRAASLLARRAISQEDYDHALGDRKEAVAAVGSARAARDTARLNLDFTKVRAPISGRVSRAMVTVGNLIESGETGGTVLTTIVSLDPMYVYFDVDDLTFQQVSQVVRDSKVTSAPDARPAVMLGLASEQGHPHTGIIDFVDNQVDPGTGTLRMRGRFPNKDGVLVPGLFARVRVPLGTAHRALLVTDRAVDTDQGQKVVYVVNADNMVEKRSVRLARLHDGLREIESGVKPGERVIVDGIQRVRGGVTVEPKLVDMPIPQDTRTSSPAPAAPKS